MAKTRVLTGSDLKLRPQIQSAARQRGAVPSAELVPIQFKMPADFVRRFKQEALDRGVKLNELFNMSFHALLKS